MNAFEMNDSKPHTIHYPQLNPFHFQIKYSELERKTHVYQINLHTHEEFEIYINLSGDISFLVGNEIYPLSRGDVILARPGEYHHCIYHSDTPHKHFWILFDCKSNPDLVNCFYKDISANYISPGENHKNELIDLCSELLDRELSDAEKFYVFFRILKILKTSAHNSLPHEPSIPEDLLRVLNYIDMHIAENIKIMEMAEALYLSESTIERRFRDFLAMTPLEYIRRKKLILAADLLRQGESVLNAGLSSGYSDNSYFIQLFKQQYGMTPYQYKKTLY